jgi:TonB family protein
LDSEALRVVRLLPKFTPGREKGKKVKVALELPIMFKFAPVEAHTSMVAATDSTKAYQLVDQMPAFPGGDQVMLMFIQKNIKYPSYEFNKNIQGKVVVGFTVNKDGSISNVLIKQGVSQGIDEEAIRVVKLFPKFRPGKQNGDLVPVVYNVPIMFKLTPTSSTLK